MNLITMQDGSELNYDLIELIKKLPKNNQAPRRPEVLEGKLSRKGYNARSRRRNVPTGDYETYAYRHEAKLARHLIDVENYERAVLNYKEEHFYRATMSSGRTYDFPKHPREYLEGI